VNGASQKVLPWVFVAFQPQHFVICSRVEFSAVSALRQAFQLWELTEKRGEGEQIVRLFQFLPFQGLPDCLSKNVTLLLLQLPLELQLQHILCLLLVVVRGFLGSFLFFLLFSIPFSLLLLLRSERAREMKRVLRTSALFTWRKECVCCVCYGCVPTRKPKTVMVGFFPKVSL